MPDEADFSSIGIKSSDLIDPIFKSLVEVAAKVSRGKFALSDADLVEIKKARDEALKTAKDHLDAMVLNVEERRKNLRLYDELQFVSVGNDCFPRTLLTRWGMKPPAALGEETHPFDISIHPSRTVAYSIVTDFKDYLEGPFEFSPQDNYPRNKRLDIQFNHDEGKEFSENNFEKLKERYARRIDNFRAALASPRRSVFIHHTEDIEKTTQQAVHYMFRAISEKRQSKDTLCIWLYTPQPDYKSPGWEFDVPYKTIEIAYPFKNYVWHRNNHTFSRRGHAFEKKAVESIKTVIEQHNWAESDR